MWRLPRPAWRIAQQPCRGTRRSGCRARGLQGPQPADIPPAAAVAPRIAAHPAHAGRVPQAIARQHHPFDQARAQHEVTAAEVTSARAGCRGAVRARFTGGARSLSVDDGGRDTIQPCTAQLSAPSFTRAGASLLQERQAAARRELRAGGACIQTAGMLVQRCGPRMVRTSPWPLPGSRCSDRQIEASQTPPPYDGVRKKGGNFARDNP